MSVRTAIELSGVKADTTMWPFSSFPPGAGWRTGVAALLLLPPLTWVELKDWLQRGLDAQGISLPPELALAADPQYLMWVLFGVTAVLLVIGALGIWWGLRRKSTVYVADATTDDGSGHEGALAPSASTHGVQGATKQDATKAAPWRPGWRAWTVLLVWALAWSWGTWAHWRQHDNRMGLTVQRTETLRLVGVQVQPPSTRGVGGAKLFLEWPEQGGLYAVVVEEPSPALLAQPERVTLSLAPGRQRGWFVLGWAVPTSLP